MLRKMTTKMHIKTYLIIIRPDVHLTSSLLRQRHLSHQIQDLRLFITLDWYAGSTEQAVKLSKTAKWPTGHV